jgi:hypothetical protein
VTERNDDGVLGVEGADLVGVATAPGSSEGIEIEGVRSAFLRRRHASDGHSNGHQQRGAEGSQ